MEIVVLIMGVVAPDFPPIPLPRLFICKLNFESVDTISDQ